MKSLELLAPARNLECGIAAIDHGADAVYIGAQRFGARAAAGNSIEDIRSLCVYAHRYAAKVYVTVNTIVFDEELAATQQLMEQLYEAGADAILVQDMGLLNMPLPPVALHASTQTDNRTADKVRWLRDMGFRRVVLARELSVDEISAIHQAVPDVELEVFVHGALCVSYSGLCYMSQYCFNRSANRGCCAQVCRMKFDLLDSNGQELIRQRYLLSLKDLNQSDHLAELIEAGATSFKIEGRLKDAAYVKNVVAYYSQRLNQYIEKHPTAFKRASEGQCTYEFTPNLQKTFNRGFTHYFLHGRTPDVYSPDTPKAMGEYVGTVKEIRRDSISVAGIASFSNGDGLCFINKSHDLEGFRVNRVQGNRLFLLQVPRNLRPGMALYRNNDVEFERLLARSHGRRKIPLTMTLEATDGGYSLSANGVSAFVESEHVTAQKPQRDNIVSQLSRLGDTPFECHAVVTALSFNDFIPSSLLSELRRSLVAKLLASAEATVKPQSGRRRPVVASGDCPAYSHSYFYNISNHLAQRFYQSSQLSAFELTGEDGGPLMQCRHCLRYSLGYCVRRGGKRPTWREPLFLRLGDGRRFRLEFDCHNCQMNVYSAR